MDSQPKIACVGAGYWGKNLVRNLYDLGVLTCICETAPQLREELVASYPSVKITDSFEAIVSDPTVTAITIATPAETHANLVRQALLAGKDVFVEKPLCLSSQIGQELICLAEQQRRILMVGHLLWYHPAVLKLKELVDSGTLGRLQYIYANRLNLGKIRREENILWSFAPHDISVVLGLLDEMPETIDTQGGYYLHDRLADVTVSLLSFPTGVKAHIFVSWLHPFKEQKLVVVGDRQMAVFDDLEPDNKLLLYPHSIEWRDQLPVPNRADAMPIKFEMLEPLQAECQHFIDCIKSRRQPRTDGHEALRVLKVLEAGQHSLESKSSVRLNDPEQPDRDYFAHESAFIDSDVSIGSGTTIWHVSHILRNSQVGKDCRIGQNVVVGPNVTIGDQVKIQNNVSVYEGVTLEDEVFCGPSMVFTNVHNPRSGVPRMDELRPTRVRRGASLGANCTIVCGVTIGQYAFVGAGAVVIKDVPDYALVVGNPSRIVGWMCACGHRLHFDQRDASVCAECGQVYHKMEQRVFHWSAREAG